MSKPCKRCNGTGVEPDDRKTGAQMAALRESCGMTQAVMARNLGISAPFLSQLEAGKRKWSVGLLKKAASMFKDPYKS